MTAPTTTVHMPALVVSADSTREQLAEALTNLAHKASREMPAVGDADHPTPWDMRHLAIDEALTWWEMA